MKGTLAQEWEGVKDKMDGKLIYADVVLQNNVGTSALIDKGC